MDGSIAVGMHDDASAPSRSHIDRNFCVHNKVSVGMDLCLMPQTNCYLCALGIKVLERCIHVQPRCNHDATKSDATT